MAFGRGMSGGAHFVGGGFAGHKFVFSHGFVRPFRRNFAFRRTFATGGLWPYYGYDYVPTDAYGDPVHSAFREIDQFRVDLHPGGLAVRPDVSDRLGPVHVVERARARHLDAGVNLLEGANPFYL